MKEHFQRAILKIAERLLYTAKTDDRLRSSIRLCAEEVLALTTEPVPPAAKEAPSQVDGEQPVVDLAPSSKPRQVGEPFILAVTQCRLFLKA